MFDITENYKVSRSLASQGMVLLKNEDKVLPLKKGNRVGVVGKGCLDLIKGGGGSADVRTEYTRSLTYGIAEKVRENKISFCEESVGIAESTEYEGYTVPVLNELAEKFDTAIVVYKRNASEGADRKLGEQSFPDMDENAYSGEDDTEKSDDYENSVGYFYPSKRELTLFGNIEKSNIKNVVLILNIASTVDLSFIEKYSKIKAVLLSYLPGMESGTAIADVLCGDVCPSGKLVDTIAYAYEDYPTADCFNYDLLETEYREDIFVGYRHFETYAKDRVMYPFGYGLSYTEFEYSDCAFTRNDDTITFSVCVKNVGEVSGREVVEAYCSAPVGNIKKPAIELKGFYKTKLLAPGESERVEITIALKDLASFDDEGVSGFKGAWVVEQGDYNLFVGKSVRELYSCGILHVEENINAEQLMNRFDGSEYIFPKAKDVHTDHDNVSLFDVAEGKLTLEEFVTFLSAEELIHLAQGQPPAFPCGTAGMGNIKKYDVPNPQTADGPAGIRRSVNCTCFPCGTLIACSWDSELQRSMGKAMGYEGYHTGVDILLGPAMNIHRNPLCGRNFEYLSEDPLVTGKTAAAIVKGIQDEGLCATIKHFAANNCEYNRKNNSSIVSERALREIYLKGFEIAVKESNPAFIMTSYNLLNGIHTSANAQLLRGVLRDDWGYEGATMTDWRTEASLVEELIGGNNLKMPFGYPDEAQKALDAYNEGRLDISILRENAVYVLRGVMKTRSFLQKDFGITHTLDKEVKFSSLDANGISSTRVHQGIHNGEHYLHSLGKDQRRQRTFVYYSVDAKQEGEYTINCNVAANTPNVEIWVYVDDERVGTMKLRDITDPEVWYDVSTQIKLHKGENTVKFVFADEPDTDYDFYNNGWYLVKEDIFLGNISLTRVGE